MALFASVCGWAEEPKQVAPVDNTTIVPVTPGDANGDGVVDGKDASLVFDISLGKDAPEGYKEKNADVNNDGIVDGKDASAIFDYSLGKITSFS